MQILAIYDDIRHAANRALKHWWRAHHHNSFISLALLSFFHAVDATYCLPGRNWAVRAMTSEISDSRIFIYALILILRPYSAPWNFISPMPQKTDTSSFTDGMLKSIHIHNFSYAFRYRVPSRNAVFKIEKAASRHTMQHRIEAYASAIVWSPLCSRRWCHSAGKMKYQ